MKNNLTPKNSMSKIYFILPILAFLLYACNGGQSSSSSNNSNLVDPPASGNGVWDYSVATDYYYGHNKESPSLWYDVSKKYNTNIMQFVFPVISTLTVPINGFPTTVTSDAFFTSCPSTGKIAFTQMFNPHIA